jgi:hypothetical protein
MNFHQHGLTIFNTGICNNGTQIAFNHLLTFGCFYLSDNFKA